MKSIKMSNYFEFKYPKYIFLKIKPSTSIRNYSSDKILNIIAALYKSIYQQIKKINHKLFFECNIKVSYYIYMEKSEIQFYFIVPEAHFAMFKDKLIDTWNNRITINIVSELPLFKQDCTKYFMTYKNEDAMSLSTDKRNNMLLGSLLNTVRVLEDGEKVGVFYNFTPTYQKSWKAAYDNTIKRLKKCESIKRNKVDFVWVLCYFLNKLSNVAELLLECVPFAEYKRSTQLNTRDLSLSKETIGKRESMVVDTQILCLSESNNKHREIDNAISLCQSFQCLNSDDNELIYRKVRSKSLDLTCYRVPKVDVIKIQPREGHNFLSLPGKELIEEFSGIEHTKVLQTEVPIKLQSGYIRLGNCEYKDTATPAFLRDTYDQGNFPLVLIGEQGSGKTTYMSNYIHDIISRNEGAIIIDYIKNCELAETIKKAVPPYRIIELDMSNISSAQGIGYNELVPRDNSSIEMLDIANRKSMYIQMLIDALNVDGDPLSSSMDRYLSAASNIVFLDSNASLKDIVRCLNNHIYRRKCIDNVPASLKDMLEDEISALNELDEQSKDGTANGTKMAKIDGINHRINFLRKDLRLKMMFQKPCKDNIDLVKAMDEGKIILVKMPQEYFATPYSKNVIVTYWLTKIWSSMLVRGSKSSQPKRFHVMIDEIFQTKTAMQLLRNQEILPQTRKFGCKFVLSCQYVGQINIIDQTLRSAGASHLLLKGSGKANFNEFKDELAPYTLDDLEALPQYHSLNMINYEDGRAKFITKLPKPIKNPNT